MKITLFFAASLLSLVCFASSIGEHELRFDDANLQARYEQLTEELRCPKCQNNNVADSDAPIARDFRVKIHQLLAEGKANDEVVDYFVRRYGEFVDYKPENPWIWWLPLLLLGCAIFIAVAFMRSQNKQKSKPLSSDEQAALAKILSEHK